MPRKSPRRRPAPRDISPDYCLVSAPTKLPDRFRQGRPVSKKIIDCRDTMFDWMEPVRTPDGQSIVEVGSQWGWWAHRAAKQLPHATIWCVDPWREDRKSHEHWGANNFYEWQLNVGQWLGERVFGLRGTSEEVVDYFQPGELDMVFIDGDHTPEGIALDLKLWVPKVRQGGLILGHDWDGIWGKHVRPAVTEYFARLGEIKAELGYLSSIKASAVWRVEKTWP